MKYFTNHKGFMIFRNENGYFPSINTDVQCESVEEAQTFIDVYLRNLRRIVYISKDLRYDAKKYSGPEALN